MVREVLGRGRCAEEIRWIAAPVAVRVGKVLVKPGATVGRHGVVELTTRTCSWRRWRPTAAGPGPGRAGEPGASLNAQHLGQESVIATLGSDHARPIAGRGPTRSCRPRGSYPISTWPRAARSQGAGGPTGVRAERWWPGRGTTPSLAQRAQVQRMKSLTEFRRREGGALRVRAGVTGVLQELARSPASRWRWARAARGRPDRLQDEVRIPETQAKESASVRRRGRHAQRPHPGPGERIDPGQPGTVRVDLSLEGALPEGAARSQRRGHHRDRTAASVLYVGGLHCGSPRARWSVPGGAGRARCRPHPRSSSAAAR